MTPARLITLLLPALAALASLPPFALAQSPAKPVAAQSEHYKVVFQVSDADPAKWNLALNNANNVLHDLGKDKVEIEIVAYGPGLAMLKDDSKVRDRLAQALDNNIGLMACENTMRNTKTTREQMYGGISYVDAGVVHIMKREREGWAYVRP